MAGGKVSRLVLAIGLVAVGLLVWRVVPLFTGPWLPAGATRLQIATERPNLTFGCPTALLAPARVATADEELILVSVESGEEVRVVWPSGFGAWTVDGRAVVSDPWGGVVGREGDVLDTLGGGLGVDDRFHICPLGITSRS